MAAERWGSDREAFSSVHMSGDSVAAPGIDDAAGYAEVTRELEATGPRRDELIAASRDVAGALSS